MKSFIIKFFFWIILPVFISVFTFIYNALVDYSEVKAKVNSHIYLEEKKDTWIEDKLGKMDNKLDTLLMSRGQLNTKLEKIINDNSSKEKR